MRNSAQQATAPNPSDRTLERRARQRYQILRGVYERTGANCELPVSGLRVGETLGLSREETFRHIHFLAHHGYLDYVGAGPRVCITPKGLAHLEEEAPRYDTADH